MIKEEIFFDQSKYADNDKAIAEYLSQFLKEGNIDEFMLAIGYSTVWVESSNRPFYGSFCGCGYDGKNGRDF